MKKMITCEIKSVKTLAKALYSHPHKVFYSTNQTARTQIITMQKIGKG
ncbi:MAG: hypothetical protein HRU09_08385 [Oligoflexales bacterium]|nr:hypothetical protein [Oligoflexales bacterium]